MIPVMNPDRNESGREASCDAPDCQPGDILEYSKENQNKIRGDRSIQTD